MASVRPEPKQKAGLYDLGYAGTKVEEDSMTSVNNRDQKQSSFGLVPNMLRSGNLCRI